MTPSEKCECDIASNRLGLYCTFCTNKMTGAKPPYDAEYVKAVFGDDEPTSEPREKYTDCGICTMPMSKCDCETPVPTEEKCACGVKRIPCTHKTVDERNAAMAERRNPAPTPKGREFWLRLNPAVGLNYLTYHKAYVNQGPHTGTPESWPSLHVIEYSAYEKLERTLAEGRLLADADNRRIKELERELSEMRTYYHEECRKLENEVTKLKNSASQKVNAAFADRVFELEKEREGFKTQVSELVAQKLKTDLEISVMKEAVKLAAKDWLAERDNLRKELAEAKAEIERLMRLMKPALDEASFLRGLVKEDEDFEAALKAEKEKSAGQVEMAKLWEWKHGQREKELADAKIFLEEDAKKIAGQALAKYKGGG